MTCYIMRKTVESEYQNGKLTEKEYKNLLKQMDEHEKLYHSNETEEAKPKLKRKVYA